MEQTIYKLLNNMEIDLSEYEEHPLSAEQTAAFKRRAGKEIRRMKDQKRRKQWKAAAAAIVCVAAAGGIGSGVCYAQTGSGPIELVQKLLVNDENVSEYVEENVFSASDEHVRFQVQELLADELHVIATVKYEALDEQGKAWISDLGSNKVKGLQLEEYTTFLSPDFHGNTVINGVNGGYGNVELDEYESEDEKVFFISSEVSEPIETVTTDQILTYYLTDGKHTTSLDTSTNVPVYEYGLEAVDDGTFSGNYEPLKIRFSKLSFSIYGHCETENIDAALDDYVDKIFLKRSDGTEIQVGTSTGCWGIRNENAPDVDEENNYIVYSSGIYNIIDRVYGLTEETVDFDPEEIVGVRIVGHQNEEGSYKEVSYKFY